MPDTPDCVRVAVSSDSPITAAAPPARDALSARLAPPPQIVATDGELLGRFTRQGDRDALDRLVDRHSAMVWRVCRATLRRPQDVEDAFQATFLLLTKNARSIKSSDSAAGWLYRVAYRTSLRARKKLSLRREEALAVDPLAPSESAFPDLLKKQTTGVLVEELMRLPAKYQTPLVLRYLEGQSRRAIADQTDTTIAGVQGRLARGKQMLRRRLLRRGVSLAAVMGALGLGARGAAAAENAPARVVVQTTSNSVALATGGSVAASAGVLSLYQEGVRAMLAIWIGKPLASTAALVAAALLLLPPGEAGESREGAAASTAPAALQLEVGLEALVPADTPDKGAVELVQATPTPTPAAVLQADRIELASQDNQLVQLRAEGDVQVTTPKAEATAIFDPGDPIPPADDRERLSRLLSLRKRLAELHGRSERLGLPAESEAIKQLAQLHTATDRAIEPLAENLIAEDLAALQAEMETLLPTASQPRETLEEATASAPPTDVASSSVVQPVDKSIEDLERTINAASSAEVLMRALTKSAHEYQHQNCERLVNPVRGSDGVATAWSEIKKRVIDEPIYKALLKRALDEREKARRFKAKSEKLLSELMDQADRPADELLKLAKVTERVGKLSHLTDPLDYEGLDEQLARQWWYRVRLAVNYELAKSDFPFTDEERGRLRISGGGPADLKQEQDAALRKYQKAKGLEPNGELNESTWNAVFGIVSGERSLTGTPGPGDAARTDSGAKMKVKVGEPAELSIDTPDKNRSLRLRYEPATDGQTATVQLTESSEQPARPAEPKALKKVASRGIMSATDAAKLRALRDDLVFEDRGDRGVNGEPLIRVTEMVEPDVLKERMREAYRIEMIQAGVRAKAHEKKREALIAEMRSVAAKDEDVLQRAVEALWAENWRSVEEARALQLQRSLASEEPAVDDVIHRRLGRAYGHSVENLQKALNESLKPSNPIEVDGEYGPQTAEAVARFQRQADLSVTAFADEATRKALGLKDRPVEYPLGKHEYPIETDDGLIGLVHQIHALRNLLETDLRDQVLDQVNSSTASQETERTPFRLAAVQARFNKINAALKKLGLDDPIEYHEANRKKSTHQREQPKLQPVKSDKKPSEPPKAERPKWPVLVESVPEHGATDVDPDLTEVRVTFDRDMQRGMSWTGNKQTFMPDVPPGAKARWIDNRTCVLPVHLKKGEFYRVGINAKSYQNFKSTDGVPAAHGAIAFSTKGAKRSIARRAQTPKVVEMTPADSETSVNPGVTKLRVTFDRKMGGGMSWTNTKAAPFPDTGGGRAAWSRDGRTCTLPVKLAPGKAYAIGLNASHAVNFQSEYGVPLPPIVWKFATGKALAANQYGPDSDMKLGEWSGVPRPSALNPKGWATIAELKPGEHAPVLLPNDERPRPHLRYDAWNQSAGESTHQFTVEDPEGDEHGKLVESSAEAGGATSVRGQPIEVIGLSDPVENGPTLVLIRNRFEENPVPSVEEARQLLQSDRVARPVAMRAPGRVDHTDGRADGKKSLGGSGHLIKFELPEGAVGVKSVRIHGSRYGTKTAPREDFEISFLSEDRSEILDIRRGAYGLFRRGAEKWTNVRFKDPVLDLPETFWVAIDFNPGRTKGVYLSYDTSTGGERSMTGLAQQEPSEHKPVDIGGDWMVSVVLERADAASLAPQGERTQPVAKTEEADEEGDAAAVEPGIELLPNSDDENSVFAHKGREYGYSVSQLQRRLNEVLDPSPGLDVDDDYGPLTTRSVERFQRESGLAATGFADAETRDALGFIEPGAAAEKSPEAAKQMTPQEEQAVAEGAKVPEELLKQLRETATFQGAAPLTQFALEQRLGKAYAEARSRGIETDDQHYVIGRVELGGGGDPQLVSAQMAILPEGYFIDLLGDAQRPIGLRMHGYDPIDLKPPAGMTRLADLGRVLMERSSEMNFRKLTARVINEAGERIPTVLSLRQLNGPINTPSNGYEPRKRFAPPRKGRSDSLISWIDFSPIEYQLTITAEGCVSQSKRIDFSEEDEIDLGEITLETPKEVEMEYLVFHGATPVSPVVFSADAFKQPLRAKLKPGERFVADPENDPHRTRFELRQHGGKLTFRSGYGSFRAADLGAVSLRSLAGTTRIPVEQQSSPEIIDGHVYLLRMGPTACHVLLKARLVGEGAKASPAEDHLAEARASIEAAEKHLADAKRLHERAAKSKSETVRRVLTKSSDQRLTAAMASLSNSGDHLELAGSRLVEQLGAGSKDLESRLEPISELSERLGKLANNNWLVKERPERLKTLIEQYDLP
ncbi:ECF RNA polymerase sigma factor SigW [Planctomycetes bacterium MalM25]|nr:ECF RNA polymerase sigma factor SigW [Planctomycetes bacterium MalM25]